MPDDRHTSLEFGNAVHARVLVQVDQMLFQVKFSSLFLWERSVTSNCELREFPEVVQSKEEKK
jgi:hypothetical protein